MKPGDLVIVTITNYLMLHHTVKSVRTFDPPPREITRGSIGIILSPPQGTWINWMVNGQVGWSNQVFLEELP